MCEQIIYLGAVFEIVGYVDVTYLSYYNDIQYIDITCNIGYGVFPLF